MTVSARTRLGPYEVLGLLGAGGMGEVYRARDLDRGDPGLRDLLWRDRRQHDRRPLSPDRAPDAVKKAEK